jgi:hypothetical protein
MPDSKLDKIIAKIKKLMALGDSPNKEEAQSAIFMAQQLIDKYNVEQGLLEDEENKIIEFKYHFHDAPYNEHRIPTICGLLFDCRVLILTRSGDRTITFVGPMLQVEMAKNAAALISLSVAAEIAVAKKILHYMGKTARNTFADGIVSKLEERAARIIEERKRNQSKQAGGTGLVVFDPTERYMQEHYPGTVTREQRFNFDLTSGIFAAGEKAGDRISLENNTPLGRDRLLT